MLEFLKTLPIEFYIITLCVIDALVIFLISYGISKRIDSKYLSFIFAQSNSVRIFILDFKSNKVDFFNISTLRTVKTISLESFLQQYPESNYTRVKKWLDSVIDPNVNPPLVLETIINLKKASKPACVLLKIDKIDYENQKVHLSSHLLKKSISIENFNNYQRVISSKSAVNKELASKRRLFGFTLTFYFVYTKSIDTNKDIDPLLFGAFKNLFYEHVTKDRYLTENSPNSISLVDTVTREADYTAEFIANSLVNGIKKLLALQGHEGEVEIYIGGVNHQLLKLKRDLIISESIACSEYALNEEISSKIVWYAPGKITKNHNFSLAYRTEVERIINSRKLRNQFRLIYNIEKGNYYGYLSKVIIKDDFFSDYDELKSYSIKTGDIKDVITSSINHLIPIFSNQQPIKNLRLFIPTRIEEKGYLLNGLTHLSKYQDIKIVLLYTEEDVLSRLISHKEEQLLADVSILKSKGFEIALVIDEEGLQLSNKFYSVFDSFVVNFPSDSGASTYDTELRASLHTLVEKLIKYHKPIICNNLIGFDSIELVVRSGLSYICSDTISPYNEMVNRINPKEKRKLDSMKGN